MTGKYRILCDEEVVGYSDLESRDVSMGTATGHFTPTAGYERIRHVFRLFAEAQRDTGPPAPEKVAAYYEARDRLHMSVETHAGVVVPTQTVHIADFREEVDELACEVEVHVTDSRFFKVIGD